MSRVAALGFDAAEWTLIEPLMRAGMMPNLSRLYSTGAHVRLHDKVAYRYGLIFQQFLYASAPLYPRASHPAGLLREIDDTFGPHPASNNDYECGWWDPQRIGRMVEALEVGSR